MSHLSQGKKSAPVKGQMNIASIFRVFEANNTQPKFTTMWTKEQSGETSVEIVDCTADSPKRKADENELSLASNTDGASHDGKFEEAIRYRVDDYLMPSPNLKVVYKRKKHMTLPVTNQRWQCPVCHRPR